MELKFNNLLNYNPWLIDSTTSPKVKTTEGERVGVCSLARNTSGVKGCVGATG
jgi:hypothetical protein